MSLPISINWGLLWFDDNPGVAFEAKVKAAANRYRDKYGVNPEVCYINPISAPAGAEPEGQVQVIQTPRVRPDYFWVGVKGRSESESDKRRGQKKRDV